ncbi:MAG: HAMP domain-containing sensor histidine kinase, partial [Alphaproteobacteria bacterium]|nr:HAMP domain-containing sensor histidine kinase [Alphaproteobacteria bacterium]
QESYNVVLRCWRRAVDFFVPEQAHENERFAYLCRSVVQSFLTISIVAAVVAICYFTMRENPVPLEYALLLGGTVSPVAGALFLRLTAWVNTSVILTCLIGVSVITVYAMLSNGLSSPALPFLFGFLVMGSGFERRRITVAISVLIATALSLLYVPGTFNLRPAYQIPLGDPPLLQYLGLMAGLTLMAIGLYTMAATWRAQRLRLKGALNQARIANEAKSQFLANMSHELRTPLNAIIGFSEVLKDQMLGPMGNPKYTEYSDDIQSSGHHLLKIINEVLDISAIESREVKLVDEEIDTNFLVTNCLAMLSSRSERGGINLKSHLTPDLPLLRADATRVRQIVINLLANALKFSPAESDVVIETFQEEDGGLTIEISDSGAGIPKEDIPRMLEPFTQVHDVNSRPHDGVGLGLYITNRLVKLHGGRLDIVSDLGRGTTVFIRFPKERILLSAA